MAIRRNERAQALIVFVFAVVGLVGIVGLAIDGSRLYAERIRAQGAADSAAMAGALASCRRGAAVGAAQTMAGQNGYDDNETTNWVTIEHPPAAGQYSGLDGHIRVQVDSAVSLTFGRVVYPNAITVSASAIARCVPTGAANVPYDTSVFRAVWAGATTGCYDDNYFDWSGSNYSILGGIHSNEDMKIGGSGSVVGGTSTVVDRLVQGGAAFNPPLQVGTGSEISDPFAGIYSFSRFNLGGDIHTAAASVNRVVTTSSAINTSWLENTCLMHGVRCLQSNVLQDGLYVTTATGPSSIEISDSNLHGDGGAADFANVTLISNTGGIKLSGSNNRFHPYVGNPQAAGARDVLLSSHGFLATTWGHGPDTCKDEILSTGGSNHQWGGFLYAPNGNVTLNGSNEYILGCVMGYTVKLNGSNTAIVCDGTWFPTGGYSLALIE